MGPQVKTVEEGTVYLLHFSRRYKHAGHYLGWTRDLDRRVRRHLDRHGSRLVQVVVEAGIGVEVARTWPGGRGRERQLKKQGGRSRMCPICRRAGPLSKHQFFNSETFGPCSNFERKRRAG